MNFNDVHYFLVEILNEVIFSQSHVRPAGLPNLFAS